MLLIAGAPHGCLVTNAVRPPVRWATRLIRVVSMAAARVIAGRMVVSRRASLTAKVPRDRDWYDFTFQLMP